MEGIKVWKVDYRVNAQSSLTLSGCTGMIYETIHVVADSLDDASIKVIAEHDGSDLELINIGKVTDIEPVFI